MTRVRFLSPAAPAVRALLTLLAFVLLAIAITWPLVLDLDASIPGGGAGDNVVFLWSFWWARVALAGPAALLHSQHLFFPFGAELALHTHAFFGALVGATVLAPFSIVTAHNIVVIGSIALNGWCTYLLAHRVTGHQAASFVAGLYFAMAPYFTGHLPGHLNLIQAWMLPLFILLALRAFDASSLTIAIAAGLVLAATLWSDYYYTAYLLCFVVVVLLSQWVSLRWTRRPAVAAGRIDHTLLMLCGLLLAVVIAIRVTGGGVFTISGVRVSATTGLPPLTAMWALGFIWLWRRWRVVPHVGLKNTSARTSDVIVLAGMALTSAMTTLPILIEAWRLLQADAYVTPPGFLRSAAGGIDPLSLAFGNPFNTFWGTWTDRLYALADVDIVENTAWFGFTGILVLLSTRGLARVPDQAVLWRTIALVFFVWSLGPYLRVFGENTGLYLPAALLRLVPVLDSLRMPGRAIVMVYLSLAVLLAVVLARLPRPRLRVWLAIAAITVIDFVAVPLPTMRLDRPEVYGHLRDLPPGAVLELPLGIRDGFGEYGTMDHRVLYYQMLHGKPMAGGFVARMTADVENGHLESPLFGPLLELSHGHTLEPDTRAILQRDARDRLIAHGFRYIVIRHDAPSPLHELVAALGARTVARDDERTLFDLEPPG